MVKILFEFHHSGGVKASTTMRTAPMTMLLTSDVNAGMIVIEIALCEYVCVYMYVCMYVCMTFIEITLCEYVCVYVCICEVRL